MKAKDFQVYRDIINKCAMIDYMSDSLEVKENIFSLAENTFIKMLIRALAENCDIKVFQAGDKYYFYIRTEEINDDLHNKILQSINNGKNYNDICKELGNIGYKVPDDVVII